MKSGRGSLVFLFILLVGLVLGGILGEVLHKTVPLLSYGKSIGFSPVLVDLSVIRLTLGLTLQINVASIIGLVLAIFLFKKL